MAQARAQQAAKQALARRQQRQAAALARRGGSGVSERYAARRARRRRACAREARVRSAKCTEMSRYVEAADRTVNSTNVSVHFSPP